MAGTVGVRFRHSGRMYRFDAAGLELKESDCVVVETARGLALGEVTALTSKEGEAAKVAAPLKPVVRLATAADIERAMLFRPEKKKPWPSADGWWRSCLCP